MILRNNSKTEWLNYVAGIDILAESTFEVPEKEGKFILRLLGHPNWVVEVGEDEVIEIIREDKVINEEKAIEVIEESKKEEVKMKRTEIMKVLKENNIKFKVSMTNAELLTLLK